MGASMCGQNVFDKLVKQHRDTFLKVVLAEKSKSVVKQKVNQLHCRSNQKFNDFQGQTNTIVQKKSDELNSIYDSAKKKVDSTIPGGIAMIERLKGQSINQFSGYNKLQSSIDGVKNNTLAKINNKRIQVQSTIQNKKSQMINKIDADKPRVPIYDQLPDVAKKQIMKKSQKQFKQQIAKNKDHVGEQALDQFNPQMLGSFFKQINPENPLQGIVGNAFSTLTQNISGTTGGGISGFISGVF